MAAEPHIVLASWGGAQYLDWWMLVHLLGGLALAYAVRVFGVSFIPALFCVGIILVGWEAYEKVAHIAEPWTNTFLDVAVGVVGIWIAYSLLPLIRGGAGIIFVITLFFIWGGLNLWGWLSWRARVTAERDSRTLESIP